MSGSETTSATFAPTAQSCAEGRRFVVRALTGWGLTGLLDTAALLTSEVITNAVLHARTPVTVTVAKVDATMVQVDVTDGSRHLPKPRRAESDDTSGRGMGLLDRLAASWSVVATDTGKTVSFRLNEGDDPWSSFTTDDWLAGEL